MSTPPLPNWVSADHEAKCTNRTEYKNWSTVLTYAISYLCGLTAGNLKKLILIGCQNSTNRQGGELSQFALNYSALIRIAFGMKETTIYEWGRINQAHSRKQL